jgi:hypothetical protein
MEKMLSQMVVASQLRKIRIHVNCLPEKYRPSLKKTLAKLAPFAAVLLIGGLLYGYSSNLRQEAITKRAALQDQKISLAKLQIQAPLLDKPIKDLKSLKKNGWNCLNSSSFKQHTLKNCSALNPFAVMMIWATH